MVNLEISENQALLDIKLIHRFLSNESSWAKGISFQTVTKSIANSLCIGAYINKNQVGFCRVITDYTTFANLVDVFIISEHRGNGISKLMLQYVMKHPELQNIRRFMLATSDAHSLYAKFGFQNLSNPDCIMQIYNPSVYLNPQSILSIEKG